MTRKIKFLDLSEHLKYTVTYESFKKKPPNSINGNINGAPKEDAPSIVGAKLDMM